VLWLPPQARVLEVDRPGKDHAQLAIAEQRPDGGGSLERR
jgi:hypothetical protein